MEKNLIELANRIIKALEPYEIDFNDSFSDGVAEVFEQMLNKEHIIGIKGNMIGYGLAELPPYEMATRLLIELIDKNYYSEDAQDDQTTILDLADTLTVEYTYYKVK